jgi:putative PIN family toxin of toxin-antitoxin system
VPTKTFIFNLLECSEITEIRNPIRACRDPRDDIFLEAEVNGNADFIITGDEDLLQMHPFKGVKIVNPTEFLNYA